MCILFICVFLWEKERSHCMIQHTNNTLGRFFSHRAHRVHWAFLRTVSNSQKASGIQSSQSLSTIIITNKGHNEAYIHSIGVSRWLLPFPSGEGKGEGPAGEGGGAIIFLNPVCSVHLWSLWEKICHSLFVIMSFCLTKITSFFSSLCSSVFKKYLSLFVIMSFCLQKNICLSPSLCHSVFEKNICLPLSLCHSVFKKTSVSLSHYVIM